MTTRVAGIRSNGLVGLELYGTVYRACLTCHEPNPSRVECPSCGTMNYSGHPCRNCGSAGGVPNPPWTFCPTCGCAALIEDRGKLTAWYANPFRQLWQIFTEWRQRRAAVRRAT